MEHQYKIGNIVRYTHKWATDRFFAIEDQSISRTYHGRDLKTNEIIWLHDCEIIVPTPEEIVTWRKKND